ncbi:COG1361 S-layer family protein [Halobellus inordinatus]|uniref:COG1361 S-layer family protein n=1 Tax=Halobellus inordinatus TaxID=1126236 RepID=UPI002113DE79|nr:sialidase [Halobellus ramosii]
MTTFRVPLGLVLLLVVVAAVPVPITAIENVTGSPDVSVQSPDNEFVPGQEASLPVYVSNEGSLQSSGPAEYVARVTTARALTLQVRSGDTPIEVNTARYPVGNVPEGTTGPIPVSITVPEDTPPGTYRLPVRVRYSYAPKVEYGSGTDGPEYRYVDLARTLSLSVVVEDRPQFQVVNVSSTARVGSYGPLSMTVRNTGTEAARDATLQLSSPDDEVTFGTGAAKSEAYSGVWGPGENRTFQFRARFAPDAQQREYPLRASVSYTDPDGIQRTSPPLTAGVTPREEVTFAVENLTSTLYVGEPGTISGSVRNTGPAPVDNAVLVYRSSNPNVVPVDTESALGRLEPGERSDFTFEVDVAADATATDRQLNLSVRYRDAQNNRQVSDELEPTVPVLPERDWLAVTPQNATFGIDTDNRLTVRVRNRENMTLSDVRARLETEPPFSSEARTAYVQRLDPGDTETLAFAVTVSEDAVPTRSSVSVNVTAERPDGKEIVLDSYVVPVTVVEETSASDTTLLAAGVLVVVLVLGAGWWWLNRR